jgi:hypothetical protein
MRVLGYLNEHGREWSGIRLSQIPERSSTLRAFDLIRGKIGRRARVADIETCTGFVFDGHESERAQFSFKKTKTAHTAIAVMQREKGLTWERLNDVETCKRYLPVLFHMHVNRWEPTATPSKFHDDRHRRFYRDLVDTLMPTGNICFFAIKNGGIPVAYSFGFDYKGTMYNYTMAVNEFYKKRSPGQIFFTLFGETFVRQGYVLDYSRGDQEYNSLFANRSTHNYEIAIYARGLDYTLNAVVDGIKKTWPVSTIVRSQKFRDFETKVARELGSGGLKSLTLKILGKLGELWRGFIVDYREYLVLRFEGTPDLTIKPKIPVKIKNLTAEDTERILTFYGSSEDSPKHKTVLERFGRKSDCIAALHDGNIISIYWGLYYADYHSELDLTLAPGENEVVLCDALTSPIYRGMKIIPYLLTQQLDDYSRRGIGVLVGVARNNKPSRKALANFNFKLDRTMKYLKIFGIKVI